MSSKLGSQRIEFIEKTLFAQNLPREPLINRKKSLGRWQSHEFSSNQFPVMRCVPKCFFIARNTILSPFYRPFSQFWGFNFTLGGIFFFLSLIAVAILLIVKNWSSTNTLGLIAAFVFALTYSFASHSSLWGLIFGPSFDRGLIFHKLFGLLTVPFGLIHGIRPLFFDDEPLDLYKSAGLVMILLAFFQIINSFFPLRRKFYKLFYFLHFLTAASFIVFAIIHEASPVFFGFGLWVLDWICKLSLILYNKGKVNPATITQVSESVVCLSFSNVDNRFRFLPGQFCFIKIPELGFFEKPHPFSIASAPEQPNVTFYIKKEARYTKRILELSKKKSEIKIDLEGPYGSYSINSEGSAHRYFVLIGGGIGATPLTSIGRSLLFEKRRGRLVNKILFIWCVRDLSLVKGMLGEPEDPFYNIFEGKNQLITDAALDFRVFLTPNTNVNFSNPCITLGRPNLDIVLSSLGREVKLRKDGKIAVFASGPKGLVSDAVSASKKAQSKTGTIFDIHTECFEF